MSAVQMLVALLLLAYVLFALARLGVHQRLPLALGPMSLERIPDRAARMHGEQRLFTCDTAPPWDVPAHRGRYDTGTSWTAARIQSTAGYLASVFRTLGVNRGDRVAILKQNHFDIHLLALGIVRCGGICCPINGRFDAPNVQPYVENIGARVLITDVVTLTRVIRDGGAFGGIDTIVLAAACDADDVMQRALVALVDEAHPHIELFFLRELLAAADVEMDAVPRAADETIYLVHSSGTTGFPKAVILANGPQSHAVRGWLSYVHLSRTYDRGLLAVPNNHQAVILTFNSALLLGLPIHWTSACARDDLDAEAIATTLSTGGYTGFFAFPIAYTLLKEVDFTRHDMSRMRFWSSTADASHAAIERVFVELGSTFRSFGLPLRGSIYLDAQGSSEVGTPSVLRYLSAYTRRFDRRIGRPGSTPRGPRVRIASNGEAVERGSVGRLEVKGRTVTPGYWNNHAMTAAALRDGWFFTGDVARQERDRHIIQLDREVDVIQTAHGPVYSLPIEERLHTHRAVFDVCVYGARQQDGTQAPAAIVALRSDVHIDPDMVALELNALLDAREQLANVEIIGWEDFPIGITGKTLKRVLRERSKPVRTGAWKS